MPPHSSVFVKYVHRSVKPKPLGAYVETSDSVGPDERDSNLTKFTVGSCPHPQLKCIFDGPAVVGCRQGRKAQCTGAGTACCAVLEEDLFSFNQ